MIPLHVALPSDDLANLLAYRCDECAAYDCPVHYAAKQLMPGQCKCCGRTQTFERGHGCG